MRRQTKKSLRHKCDILCSKLCRSHGRCERCGKQASLQWCHFISRTVIRLRYKPLNFACLCYGCHSWGHKHPKAFSVFWDKLKGPGSTLKLEKMSNQIWPITINWYQQLYNKLKKLCDEKRLLL